MPPHCDTLDGPVVKASKMAFEKNNVNYILPWVPRKAEAELRKAFEKTPQARRQGKEAMEIADYWFFETAVRLHREGEGAPYTRLKPAGLDWGPVVPRAEKAKDLKIPHWRTLKADGFLNEKYPGGREAQKKKLEDEGFKVCNMIQ